MQSELPKVQSRARRRAPDEKAVAVKERIAAKKAAAKAANELEQATQAMSRLAVEGVLSAAVARVVATAGGGNGDTPAADVTATAAAGVTDVQQAAEGSNSSSSSGASRGNGAKSAAAAPAAATNSPRAKAAGSGARAGTAASSRSNSDTAAAAIEQDADSSSSSSDDASSSSDTEVDEDSDEEDTAASAFAKVDPNDPALKRLQPPSQSAAAVGSSTVKAAAAVDLESCLAAFTKEEQLSAAGGNGYLCIKCSKKGEC
jgi:hypothetical protein